MLRAKSYKKKLKKSQIKLRKHKTYSIKGGNRNNNSRSKKKQKGGGEQEQKEAHQQGVAAGRGRRRKQQQADREDALAEVHTLFTEEEPEAEPEAEPTSPINRISVRDYIEGDIFNGNNPGGYKNLNEIIKAALAAAASSSEATAEATAAQEAVDNAVTEEQKKPSQEILEKEKQETKIAGKNAATAAAAKNPDPTAVAAAEAAKNTERPTDDIRGEEESTAGGDLQALVDMLTMILKDDETKGGGKKKIYRQKGGGFDYQPETKIVENIINKYKEQQKENISSYANDMNQANKDGSGDALVNFLRGAWIDYINSNLTIEKVGGQPNIQNVKEIHQTISEDMMMDALNELIIKDDIEIIKTLDKYSKIKKFPEVFRTNQDLINKFFNEDWLEHTANYERKTKDLIPNFKLAVTNKDISKLESAGNEGAGEGAALPSSARTVVNAISVSPDKSPAVNAEPVLSMGGGPNLSRPNFNQDSINTVVEGITQSHQGFLSDIITNINSIDSVDVHASNAAKIEKLNTLLTNAQAFLQRQISNLRDVNNEFRK